MRWEKHKSSTVDPWLARMLNRKPPMLVIGGPANKMACIVRRNVL